MKTIGIVTATRAEYGLLKPLILALKNKKEYMVKVIVTGSHLSPEFGLTYRDIERDGVNIDKKIEMLLSSDTPASISKSMGVAMIGFADYFAEEKLDAIIILGDRYEMLAVAIAAMNERIPIIHLYGGDTSEGAVDEGIRHAITKLSYIHLTCTEESKRRVIQMGENPSRVFVVGSLGVENALKQKLLSKNELQDNLKMDLSKKYAVVTYHPVTLEKNSAEKQCRELVNALDAFPNMSLIITKANADTDGRIINKLMQEYADSRENVKLFDSLGLIRYLSAVKYASMIIGNSSSGLAEVPSFHIPTVNIGDRQKGRLKPNSVIDCENDSDSIINAINKALSDEFIEICKNVNNPYGDGNTVMKIIDIIDSVFIDEIDLKKNFYEVLSDMRKV